MSDILIPAGIAVVGVFIAWKLLAGLVKLAAMVVIVGLAAYLYFGGVL
ncbi:MAG: hypothetical protein P0Y56_01180 [Candidatus Andeanibacterium colombiense]|uniref:Uncharacterized protein n=1 Tax=Candidatus Andeanibacterium colombiense TaxID=3121345 RepID=A0AAJ6BR82_9SPHN|nr:MAG: hypothetical protein P0Y56_01180 [Sphingomonadaceae bacterium]